MITGTVKHFKSGRYGHISRPGLPDLLVPGANIVGPEKTLVAGETVEFEEVQGRDGRPVAINVRRVDTRLRGNVKDWDWETGTGHVQSAELGDPLPLHVSNVLDGYCHLEPGEPVEFTITTVNGDAEATRLLRQDPVSSGKRSTGKVLDWKEGRGFGFIQPDDGGENIFIYHKDILGGGFKRLDEGEPVQYRAVETHKGIQAVDLVRLDVRTALERFANLGRFDEHLSYLAHELAQEEQWDYRRKPQGGVPILWSYILHTFMRLQAESKIALAQKKTGERCACFNTGLVTKLQQEIFAVFGENRKRTVDDPDWFLQGFFDEAMPPVHVFPQKPELATYWTDPADLVFDPSRRVEVNKHHIILERGDRFPSQFQGHEQMMILFLDSMVNMSLRRVRRNYKTAVPQYHRGRMELLLPLCLNPQDPQSVDLALVLSREDEVYKASTVLPLDWAYRNARLLARPDPEWLQP